MVHIPTTERKYEQIPQKVNSLQAYSSALLKPAQEYQQEIKRQQDIKINSNLMQAQVDADEFMHQHQLKYQANPNSPEAQAELKSGLQGIYNKYGESIDPMFRQKWQLASNKSQNAYQIVNNRWVEQQRQKNAQIDMANSMNIGFQRAYSLGKSGNLDQAIADLTQSYNSIRENLVNTVGEVNAEELTKDYKKKFATSYVDGLMQTDPEKALQTINDKSYQNLFDDMRDIDKMKEYGIAKLEHVKEVKKANNIYNDIIVGDGLLNKSMTTNLSIEEIERLTPQSASKDYKELILKLNGYSTKKGTKFSNEDKIIALQEIEDNFAVLVSNEDTTPEDWKKFQDDIVHKMNIGVVSIDKGMNLSRRYAVSIAEDNKETLKDRGWLGQKSFGYEDLEKAIPQEETKGLSKEEKKKVRARNALIKNRVVETYYSALKDEVEKSSTFETMQDLFNASKSDAEKVKVLGRAREKALTLSNQERFERLRGLDKQPNSVLDGYAKTTNSTLYENSKQGTPVKSNIVQVRISGNKYYGRTQDGAVIEISKQQYNQFKGL